MSTSIHLIAAIGALAALVAVLTAVAFFVRSKWAYVLYRITTDLAWVNVWTQLVLLTNPLQNATMIFWGLSLLYAILFYVARPGGLGLSFWGRKARFGEYTRVLSARFAALIWYIGFASLLMFGQGEFIGKELSSPQLMGKIWIDNQQNIGYDHYQQGSINVVYLYNHQKQTYDTIKADINLDNQVDVVLTLNELNKFDWEVYTYARQIRIIMYIIAGLSMLGLLGMKRREVFDPQEPDAASMRQHMRQFINNTQMQAFFGTLLLLPLGAQAMTIGELHQNLESYAPCVGEHNSQVCSELAKSLGIDHALIMDDTTRDTLNTYLELYKNCLGKPCPPAQFDMIESARGKWLTKQQDLSNNFDQVTKDLAENIAGDSFLYTLESIPVLGSDILALLNMDTDIATSLKQFQISQELDTNQREVLESAILQTNHEKFYQSLMWLAEKSLYINDTKLKTANFKGSNLHAASLIKFRTLASSVDQHHAFIEMNSYADLTTNDIVTHLLVAETISYLTENNPLFPPRYYLGKLLKNQGYPGLSYSIGYIEEHDSIYMEQASHIIDRDYSTLKEDAEQAYMDIVRIRRNDNLSLREQLKGCGQAILDAGQLQVQLWIRGAIAKVDKSSRLGKVSHAHVDLLFDLGM